MVNRGNMFIHGAILGVMLLLLGAAVWMAIYSYYSSHHMERVKAELQEKAQAYEDFLVDECLGGNIDFITLVYYQNKVNKELYKSGAYVNAIDRISSAFSLNHEDSPLQDPCKVVH